MKKIVVRIRGGLGNQLFILSFAYYVISKLKINNYEIVLDTREYKRYKVRDFELLNIIKDTKIRMYEKENDKNLKYDISRKIYHVVQKFMPKNKPIIKLLSKNGLLFSVLNSECMIPSDCNNIYIYGYFQDAKMMKEVKNDLLNKIDKQCCDSYLDKKCKNIAVSIRWGQDYVKNNWPICTEKYYREAIDEIIERKYKDKNVNILIFSDEIEKVKKLNLYRNAIYIEKRTPVEQLKLLLECDDYIISNSSFSWIGAYLGAKDESIIISPNYWYNKKETTDKTLLYFPNLEIRVI